MGKRYYCDYCDKTMSCTPTIIKTHNNGILHQKAKQDHFQKFKDAETILAEEAAKKPCARFPYGQCQFDSICRFSHYSAEAIQCLQNYVATKQLAHNMVTQPCFQNLYNQLQIEKSAPQEDDHMVLLDNTGITHKLPWSYNKKLDEFSDLPPSLRRISIIDFVDCRFNEWG